MLPDPCAHRAWGRRLSHPSGASPGRLCLSQPPGRAGLTLKCRTRLWKSNRVTCLGRSGCDRGLGSLLQGSRSLSISHPPAGPSAPGAAGLSVSSEASEHRLEQSRRFSAGASSEQNLFPGHTADQKGVKERENPRKKWVTPQEKFSHSPTMTIQLLLSLPLGVCREGTGRS